MENNAKYFDVVASVLDRYGNRKDAHMICGYESLEEAWAYRYKHWIGIVNEYCKYCNEDEDEYIAVDIEIKDEDGNLIEIDEM